MDSTERERARALRRSSRLLQIRTILAAVADPDARIQPALNRAAEIAAALGARIVVFHAAFSSALSGRPFFNSTRLARSRGWLVEERTRALEKRVAELRRMHKVDVCVTWEEPAHEAIVRAALRESADLVIAGRHERRGDSRSLRLTDWELMRQCPRPLLLTRASTGIRRPGAVIAALDPLHAHDKPASLDLSIARHAAAFAGALQLDCHAAHFIAPGYPDAESAAERRRMRQRVSIRMQRVMKVAGADEARLHVADGSPTADLPKLTKRLAAQMLVMGVVSRRGVQRLAIGDTAESIIRAVACDILLIKPDGFRLKLSKTNKESFILPTRI